MGSGAGGGAISSGAGAGISGPRSSTTAAGLPSLMGSTGGTIELSKSK